MSAIASEAQLVSLALALIGDNGRLSPAEAKIAQRIPAARKPRIVAGLRSAICTGGDPLGDAFTTLRSPEQRRPLGATYTPAPIVAAMTAWAHSEATPIRIIDPGAGSGRFLMAAAQAFPHADLIGVELDPVAALMLRANLMTLGLASRSRILVSEFCRAPVPPRKGPTLFIGNPPYVRHHDIAPAAKDWYGRVALQHGVKASKLAGLHLYFYLRTLQLADAGDIGCFITAAEWMDVNYGAALRQLLAGPLGGTCLTVLDPKVAPFADAATTSAIVGFRVQRRPETLAVRSIASLGELARPRTSVAVPWKQLENATRWSTIIRPGAAVPSGHVELGELCRVHRGQVTGSNDIWIAGPHSTGIPERFLLPTITRARELIEAGDILRRATALRRVIDLPVDLDDLPLNERRAVARFLTWAKREGGHESYIARHRRAWWSVGLKDPAPILCTYMARRPPAFVRNACAARHINIAHGIYPREPLASNLLDALASWLRRKVQLDQGRTYAGGLTKFEPKEVERLPVPSPQDLVHGAFA